MRKVIIIWLLTLILGSGVAQSQEVINFYYIALDETTPKAALVEQLREYRDDAVRLHSATIFYLASQNDPIVIEVNTPNDNSSSFDEFIKNIYSHDYMLIAPTYDVENIVSIISSFDYERNGELICEMNMKFYVGIDFWNRGYNESLLASLYFILDLHRYLLNGLTFDVFSHEAEEINEKYNAGTKNSTLFGNKNINKISEDFKVYNY